MREGRLTRSRLLRSLVVIPLSILLSLLVASIGKGNGRDWIKGFVGTPKGENTPPVRCEMVTVTSTGGHLSGRLIVINESTARVQIQGEVRKDGTVWPIFRAQARKASEKEWRTLAEPAKSPSLVTLTVDAFSEQEIWVDMDIFRSAIAKATYGRIVLSNGIWAMFDLGLFVDD